MVRRNMPRVDIIECGQALGAERTRKVLWMDVQMKNRTYLRMLIVVEVADQKVKGRVVVVVVVEVDRKHYRLHQKHFFRT